MILTAMCEQNKQTNTKGENVKKMSLFYNHNSKKQTYLCQQRKTKKRIDKAH